MHVGSKEQIEITNVRTGTVYKVWTTVTACEPDLSKIILKVDDDAEYAAGQFITVVKAQEPTNASN